MATKYSKCRIAVCFSFAVLFGGVTEAQVFRFDNVAYSAGVMSVAVGDVNQVENDYFTATKDRRVKQLLYNVERNHLNKGVLEKIASGNYKFALADINFAMRYFPNHPTGLHLITTVAALTKNQTLPIPYFEKAIAFYPSHAITHAQYGWFFVTIGDLENGLQKLKHAVEMDPKLTAGYVWLAQAYEKKGDFELAHQAKERAKELGYKGKLPGDPGR